MKVTPHLTALFIRSKFLCVYSVRNLSQDKGSVTSFDFDKKNSEKLVSKHHEIFDSPIGE